MEGKHIKAEPYNWPHDGLFNPQTTALVIIDMQNDFCTEGGYLSHQGIDITPLTAVIPNIRTLLHAFRKHSFPIYHTREGHRPDLSSLSSRELFRSRNNPSGLGIGSDGPMGKLLIRGEPGHDIIPSLYPIAGEPIIDKPGKSAFQFTDFELLLKVRGVGKLVVCGVTTDVCVATTVREATDKGYECLVVGDACAAAEEGLHEGALQSVMGEGGIFGAVGEAEDVLALVESLGKGSASE